jgi:hypothetical protein
MATSTLPVFLGRLAKLVIVVAAVLAGTRIPEFLGFIGR